MTTKEYKEGWDGCCKGETCPYLKDSTEYRRWWAGWFAASNDPARQHEEMTEQYFASRGRET